MKLKFPSFRFTKSRSRFPAAMQALSQEQSISPPVRRRYLSPHLYNVSSSQWIPLAAAPTAAAPLARGTLLRIISWNIDFSIPSHGDRTSTALDHLASLFSPGGGAAPTPMVLMLQEMSAESLTAILSHSWVQENFIVSEKTPLPQRYFTLLLVDRRLVTAEWFRIAYQGSMFGRDVLGVDVMLAFDDDETTENQRPTRRLRFCTTHLESLAEEPGFELRPKQLALVSSLLKEDTLNQNGYKIVGGLVGGDMNAISELDVEIHRRPDVGLRDIWEENIQSQGPSGTKNEETKLGEQDPTLGRTEGHTWGYQARGRWPPRRFDKFFYTGELEMVALEEVEDSSRKVGRLGIGLKTDNGLWISDHFGIAVGVKVL